MKFKSKWKTFHSRKCIWKCRLWIGGYFVKRRWRGIPAICVISILRNCKIYKYIMYFPKPIHQVKICETAYSEADCCSWQSLLVSWYSWCFICIVGIFASNILNIMFLFSAKTPPRSILICRQLQMTVTLKRPIIGVLEKFFFWKSLVKYFSPHHSDNKYKCAF